MTQALVKTFSGLFPPLIVIMADRELSRQFIGAGDRFFAPEFGKQSLTSNNGCGKNHYELL
jgi:hypothetical protein